MPPAQSFMTALIMLIVFSLLLDVVIWLVITLLVVGFAVLVVSAVYYSVVVLSDWVKMILD